MPGTFTPGKLAAGQLASLMGPILSIPVGSRAYIKFFNLYNTNAATITIDLRVYDASGGTTRRWRRIELEQDESYDVLEYDRSIELSALDSIQASASVGSAIDYLITGVIET